MYFSSFHYIEQIKNILDSFPHDQFERLIKAMLDIYKEGRQIFVMGNGGSGTTASHLTADIGKTPLLIESKRFKILCLNDNMPTILAYANDLSYEDIFVSVINRLEYIWRIPAS